MARSLAEIDKALTNVEQIVVSLQSAVVKLQSESKHFLTKMQYYQLMAIRDRKELEMLIQLEQIQASLQLLQNSLP